MGELWWYINYILLNLLKEKKRKKYGGTIHTNWDYPEKILMHCHLSFHPGVWPTHFPEKDCWESLINSTLILTLFENTSQKICPDEVARKEFSGWMKKMLTHLEVFSYTGASRLLFNKLESAALDHPLGRWSMCFGHSLYQGPPSK